MMVIMMMIVIILFSQRFLRIVMDLSASEAGARMAKLYGLDVASPFPIEPSQLNRSSQFWEAADSGKQPILGSSRFWEAADSGKQPIMSL